MCVTSTDCVVNKLIMGLYDTIQVGLPEKRYFFNLAVFILAYLGIVFKIKTKSVDCQTDLQATVVVVVVSIILYSILFY